jgi:hypothetical protein
MPEIIYLGHDNSSDHLLKSNGVAVSLSGVTRMTLTLGSKLIDSDNGDADPIRWAKAGYATGEFRLFLGAEVITPGNYQGVLIVYDGTNPNGVVWGRITISVMADPEGTA